MISFLCSHCGVQLRVRSEMAGTARRCPRCGQQVEAPADGTITPGSGPAPAVGAAAGGKDREKEKEKDGNKGTFEAAHSGRSDPLDFLAPAQGPGEIGRLGPYRVLKVLGAGGMGIVLQAEEITLKRQVALKVMKKAQAKNGENRKRFVLEAQAAAAIEHDHIVTIYAVGEDRGVPYIAMKLLQGESLEARLNRMGKLPVPEVLRIGQEIAEGLAAAHERGLIHRDIKPANIWLEEGRDRVKIVDFGLARACDEDVKLTQDNYMVGTPMYMSPEQADGDLVVDHRCDLFSLGGVLYRMSTGELPFKGKTTMQVLSALASKKPRPPREINPEVPRTLQALILKLLEKDREDRPRGARLVVAALADLRAAPPEEQQVADDPPAAAEEEEVVELEPVPERRPRPRPHRPRPAARSSRSADQAARKAIRFAILGGVIVVLVLAALVIKNLFFTKKDTAAPGPGQGSEQPKQSSRLGGVAVGGEG